MSQPNDPCYSAQAYHQIIECSRFFLFNNKYLVLAEDNIHPSSPGFRVPAIFFFSGAVNCAIIWHAAFGLSAGSCLLAESEWFSLVSHLQQLLILLRLAVHHFSTEVYTSTLGRCSGRKWTKIWKTVHVIFSSLPPTRHLCSLFAL